MIANSANGIRLFDSRSSPIIRCINRKGTSAVSHKFLVIANTLSGPELSDLVVSTFRLSGRLMCHSPPTQPAATE
jgi:hypothetical protein